MADGLLGKSYRISTYYNGYGNVVYVSTGLLKEDEPSLLEDDYVTIYGVGAGDYTYESVMGASITIPYINAYYIDR